MYIFHTYCTNEVGIVLVGLANVVTCGCKVAVAEIVGIVTAHEIYGTVLISSVIVVWQCSDVGIACERKTCMNKKQHL